MSWQHRNSELQNNPIICGKHSKYWSNCQNQTQGWKILRFIAIPSNLLIHALRDKYNRRSNHPEARFSPLHLVTNEIQPLLLMRMHHIRKWSDVIFILSLSKYRSLTAALWHSSRSFQSCYLLLPPSTTVHPTTASCYLLAHPLIPLRPTQSDSELNQLDSKCAWI